MEARCVLTDRRLTVLHAPGGFGKTALLGHCWRALREQGVAVAWLSLDEEDGPGSLAGYLALAFEAAGLGTFGEGMGSKAGEFGVEPGPQADTQADWRINRLVRAVAGGIELRLPTAVARRRGRDQKRRGPRIPDAELLTVLDGKLAGRSLRLIAVDLYGAARVAAEWRSDGAMRARVRWRVKQALRLMNGGYRELASGGS